MSRTNEIIAHAIHCRDQAGFRESESGTQFVIDYLAARVQELEERLEQAERLIPSFIRPQAD